MKTISVKIHSIEEDGYPDMNKLVGRVAFIFYGCIVSGWPLFKEQLEKVGCNSYGFKDGDWEANSNVGLEYPFRGVTHWIEFPTQLTNLEE